MNHWFLHAGLIYENKAIFMHTNILNSCLCPVL